MKRLLFAILLCCVAQPLPAQELRGLWVDAFNSGFKTPAQVTQLIADARAANVNALFVQVRKRGDAYYDSALEPKATDVSPQSFDPLADLISKSGTGGPKVQIHAWIVTYNIWNGQSTQPSQASHPYRVNPDWLTQRQDGTLWDGANYAFDPAHPDVQEHTFQVCQDILSRYAVDGLHFDYIRYTDADASVGNQPWGYHPVAVQRFNTLYSRTGEPAPNDTAWLQFRRDQVSALVRKVYLHAWNTRPSARISAACIAYGSAPAANTATAFQSRDAWGRVLQDWRGWLDEGILDLAVPMVYRDYTISARRTEYEAWNTWTRDNQMRRASAMGAGHYLNTVPGTITETKLSRNVSASGAKLAGIVGYSYASWCRRLVSGTTYESNYLPRADFIAALTDDAAAEVHDPGGTPVFQNAAAIPAMPWKTDTARGHVMGFVHDAATGADLDGAVLTLSLTGQAARSLKTDATGFYGGVDLPAGMWTLAISAPGYRPRSLAISAGNAAVTVQDLLLEPQPLEFITHVWSPAARTMTLTWHSRPGISYRIQASWDLQTWINAEATYPSQGWTTSWTSPAVAAGETRWFYRVAVP